MTRRKILGSVRRRFRVINIVRINMVKIRSFHLADKTLGKNNISSRFEQDKSWIKQKRESLANTRGAYSKR